MVESKRALVLATCFLSGAASIITFLSIFTQEWVSANGRFKEQEDSGYESNFNYGLFGGTYFRNYGQQLWVDVSMTCSYGNNICAVLCARNSDRRSEILDELYSGSKTGWTVQECSTVKSIMFSSKREGEMESVTSKDGGVEKSFINAYAYLFTLIFLILSALAGLVSAGMSVWNTASNPIEVYFNIFGLYIYNGIAFCTLLVSILIWGIMFFSSLIDNPAFIAALTGDLIPSEVALGWSYWINMASLLLYSTSIGMLYLRSYLISKEPQLKVEIEDNTPAGILLF